MTSPNRDFWFSDVRYQFPSDHASISRRTPYVDYWFSAIFSGFFSSEAFIKQTNRVSTDVADKHARYISGPVVGEVEKVTNELGDNGAHHCVDYCFCKRTAIISAAKVRRANASCDALFLCPTRMAANRSCFSGIFMSLTPNRVYSI